MSCGQPHDVDCSLILEQVYEFLDGEASDGACHQIQHHLDECAPCLRKFGLEKSVKALVARSCGSDPVPDEVRIGVIARIREVRIEIESTQIAQSGTAE